MDRFGAGGDEVDARHEYEQALRDGAVNVLVLAPTESASSGRPKFFDDTEVTSSTSLAGWRSSSWVN
jgi:hypothetical protein